MQDLEHLERNLDHRPARLTPISRSRQNYLALDVPADGPDPRRAAPAAAAAPWRCLRLHAVRPPAVHRYPAGHTEQYLLRQPSTVCMPAALSVAMSAGAFPRARSGPVVTGKVRAPTAGVMGRGALCSDEDDRTHREVVD